MPSTLLLLNRLLGLLGVRPSVEIGKEGEEGGVENCCEGEGLHSHAPAGLAGAVHDGGGDNAGETKDKLQEERAAGDKKNKRKTKITKETVEKYLRAEFESEGNDRAVVVIIQAKRCRKKEQDWQSEVAKAC